MSSLENRLPNGRSHAASLDRPCAVSAGIIANVSAVARATERWGPQQDLLVCLGGVLTTAAVVLHCGHHENICSVTSVFRHA